MDKLDFGVIGLYVLIILLITLFTFKPHWGSIFKSSKKAKWWIPGLSLFMMVVSADGPQLITGIVYNQGIWGLWILWVGILTVGVVPILFAPLWSKLGFVTDNQFLLFRFSGKSAKILFNFRAIYLGVVIVPFILSFQFIAFQNVLMVYFDISSNVALLITGFTAVLFALKNGFEHKLKTDVLHAFIYLATLIIAAVVLINIGGGWSNILAQFRIEYPAKLNMFPNFSDESFRIEFLTYVLVIWWSANMFDGGGAEMQRFVSIKGRLNVIKAALLPTALKQLVFMVVIIIVISGMVINKSSLVAQNHEASFLYSFTNHMPSGIKGLSLIAFFVAFITTTEALLNWGAALLVVDVYKRNITTKPERHYVIISILIMVLMVVLSLAVTYFNNSLYGVLQLLLSLSAGVAPVFILRWVWLRINAWSQLSAMLSSLLYTYIFPYVKVDWLTTFGMYDKTARVLFVTVFTTLTWLIITILTPKDDTSLLKNFRDKIPQNSFSAKNIITAFLVGIITILVLLLMLKVLFSW